MENNTFYWIGFILIGGVIGWLTGSIVKSRWFGPAGDMALGVGGAVLGGWLFGALGLFKQGAVGAFSLTALAGTIAMVTLVHLIRRAV